MSMKLRVVTPTGRAIECDAEYVTLPGAGGELGVYPNHVPLVTSLVPGELMVRETGGKQSSYAIAEGFAQILPDCVNVLTELATSEADIDERAAEEAMERARAALEQRISDEEIAAAEAALARAAAQLRLKRRNR
jgi:F-type H+-transporting ATPase subunit epsilon